MSEKLRDLGRKVVARLNHEDERIRRRWQAIIGVLFMAVFVFASIAVNQTVLALNQAAGNYGYYGNSYGYQASQTTSDDLPSAPTSLSSSVLSGTSASINWNAPTTTVASTSLDNLSDYLVHYGTSSLSSCSGGTQTTTTSTAVTLTGLSTSTTYYVAVCARDTNSNNSAALTGSFSTSSSTAAGGGGGGGGSSVLSTPTTTTTTTTSPTVSPTTGTTETTTVSAPTTANLNTILSAIGEVVNAASEASALNLMERALGGATVSALAEAVRTTVVNYVAYGNSVETQRLGSGERASTVENFNRVFGEIPTSNTDYQALHAMVLGDSGRPVADIKTIKRALFAESDFLAEFRRVWGHFPCETSTAGSAACSSEWLALEIMTYGYKPLVRSLDLERKAILGFRDIVYVEDFKGVRDTKAKGAYPSKLGHWNAIRGCVYGSPDTCPLLP